MPKPDPTLTELLIFWPEDAENQFARLFARAIGGTKAAIWLQAETLEPAGLRVVGSHGFATDELRMIEAARIDLQDEKVGARALNTEKPQIIWTSDHQEMGHTEQGLLDAFQGDTLYCCALKLLGNTLGLIYTATAGSRGPSEEELVSATQVAQALSTGLHHKRLKSWKLRTDLLLGPLLNRPMDLILTSKAETDRALKACSTSTPCPCGCWIPRPWAFWKSTPVPCKNTATAGKNFSRSHSETSAVPAELNRLGNFLEPPDPIGPDLNNTLWQHVTRLGEKLEMQISTHPLKYQGLDTVLVVLMDVTEQNRMELALRESEQKFRHIAENTVNFIRIYDAQSD